MPATRHLKPDTCHPTPDARRLMPDTRSRRPSCKWTDFILISELRASGMFFLAVSGWLLAWFCWLGWFLLPYGVFLRLYARPPRWINYAAIFLCMMVSIYVFATYTPEENPHATWSENYARVLVFFLTTRRGLFLLGGAIAGWAIVGYIVGYEEGVDRH